MPRARNDILQGTLALLVLNTLASRGRLHGYGITSHIQLASAESLRVEEGSLYPALHSMEQDGWLKSEWRRRVSILVLDERESRSAPRPRPQRWRLHPQGGAGAGHRQAVAAILRTIRRRTRERVHGGGAQGGVSGAHPAVIPSTATGA